jgi:ferredoxin
MDPRQILPEARSVVAMAFRIMRGSLRGVEEGTFFSNYSSMGYGGLSWLYMPMVVLNLSKFIEDHGHEAVPYGHLSPWRGITGGGSLKADFSRPVAPGRAQPDVMVHLRIAAFLSGLGEIGYSKLLLTPEFGPRQRIGIVITEAPLEPDPLYDGAQLCDRCMACARECPGDAIPRDSTVRARLAGREVEWAEIDIKNCDVAFRGADPQQPVGGGDGPAYAQVWGEQWGHGSWSPFHTKPHNVYTHGQAICAGRGCIRACMVHLEERGVLRNEFETPFRRRKPWTVDWSAPALPAEDPYRDWRGEQQ